MHFNFQAIFGITCIRIWMVLLKSLSNFRSYGQKTYRQIRYTWVKQVIIYLSYYFFYTLFVVRTVLGGRRSGSAHVVPTRWHAATPALTYVIMWYTSRHEKIQYNVLLRTSSISEYSMQFKLIVHVTTGLWDRLITLLSPLRRDSRVRALCSKRKPRPCAKVDCQGLFTDKFV